jgi:hypothetical protein
MLRLEIDSPELDLMQRIFCGQRGVRIPAISIGKFCGNFVKLGAVDVQEFNRMNLFRFN